MNHVHMNRCQSIPARRCQGTLTRAARCRIVDGRTQWMVLSASINNRAAAGTCEGTQAASAVAQKIAIVHRCTHDRRVQQHAVGRAENEGVRVRVFRFLI